MNLLFVFFFCYHCLTICVVCLFVIIAIYYLCPWYELSTEKYWGEENEEAHIQAMVQRASQNSSTGCSTSVEGLFSVAGLVFSMLEGIDKVDVRARRVLKLLFEDAVELRNIGGLYSVFLARFWAPISCSR